jgi:hypothetical protein
MPAMTKPQPERFPARLSIDFQAMPHNSLLSAAEYLSRRVAERAAANDRAGIAFDAMAALTMTAFAIEALMNAMGARLYGSEWPKARKDGKRQAVFAALNMDPDMTVRPYSSLEELWRIRASLAHGKPYVIQRTWIAEGTHDEHVASLRAAEAEMDYPLPDQFVADAYEDVDTIWQTMLATSGLAAIELCSGGSSGFSRIEHP